MDITVIRAFGGKMFSPNLLTDVKIHGVTWCEPYVHFSHYEKFHPHPKSKNHKQIVCHNER